MSFELQDLAAGFVAAIRARDERSAELAYQELGSRAREADRPELTAAVATLAPFLTEVRLGDGAIVANVAGDLLHLGADPTDVLPVLVDRIADALERAATFPTEWEKATGEPVPPDPEDRERIQDVAALLTDADARAACEAWYSAGDWVPALLVPLQNKEIRVALPHRERLIAAATATADTIDPARWLLGLSLVLDDATLLVLHPDSAGAYTVTISGIGDLSQLHTLLADALLGTHLPGNPPDPTEVAAATNGNPQPPNGIRGQFTLTDAQGNPLPPESRPSDLPLVWNTRVLLLTTPPIPPHWTTGRVYPLMHPTLTVDAVLPAPEAATWLTHCSPNT